MLDLSGVGGGGGSPLHGASQPPPVFIDPTILVKNIQKYIANPSSGFTLGIVQYYKMFRPPPSYAIRPNVHQFNTAHVKFDKLKYSVILGILY